VAGQRVVTNGPIIERRVKRAMIRDDEALVSVGVLEEVVHPLELKPAVDKVEIALLVLADVLLHLVLVVEPEGVLVRREASALEDFLDDVGDRLTGEDAAVARARKMPESRHEEDPVEPAAVDLAEQFDRAQDSMQLERLASVFAIRDKRRLAADAIGEIEV